MPDHVAERTVRSCSNNLIGAPLSTTRLLWLPFTDIMPNSMQDVHVCNADRQLYFGEVTYRDEMLLGNAGRVLTLDEVTHWMPALKLPPRRSL